MTLARPTMVKLALLALLAPAAIGMEFTKEDLETDDSLWNLYEHWGAHYMVRRDPGEKLRRFSIFKEKARRVYTSRLQSAAGDTLLGLNIFADRSYDEVRRDYNCRRAVAGDDGGKKKPNVTAATVGLARRGNGTLPLPSSVDWSTSESCICRPRCLTAVKDQGNTCGSCWAFAATAALEAHNTIRRNSLVRLSEQELIDCDTERRALAGWRRRAATYPYTGRNGTCKAAAHIDLGMEGFELVPAYDEFQLMEAVTYGPVVVSIAVHDDDDDDEENFMDYTGGVYRGPCGPNNDHEMLLVSYHTT